MDNYKIEIFENLCRTCMREQHTADSPTATKSFISIYEEHETQDSCNMSIMELLMQTSPQLNVEADDMLPKVICKNCLEMLGVLHEFQRRTLRVEQRLRDIVKEYCPLNEVVDPLNNTIQEEFVEDIKIEIDEPVTLVHTSVYPVNKKCDTDDDVGVNSKAQFDTPPNEPGNNGNEKQLNVLIWKYIDRNYQDPLPVMEEQSSKEKKLGNDEVNCDRKVKNLNKSPRILRNSNRELEVTDEILDNSDDEDVDSQRSQTKPTARSNDTEEGAEDESISSEVSDCNDSSVEDDVEWEPPLNKSERFKSKSIKDVNQLEGNQQDNLDLKQGDKNIVSRIDLNTHQQNQHSAEKGYICPECGARLKTRVTLRRHRVMHETDVTKIKFQCHYCNRAFAESRTLRFHIRMHTGERPYLCSTCGKSFATQCSLKQHSIRHDTEFNYQCPKCPKIFSSSSGMSTHKATVHSKVRPHVCDVCGATFKKPYTLKKHKNIHGEKKFKCDYCDRKFAQIDPCRRHMRTHTGEKPYKCRYCERAYNQSNDMIKHLRVHLGDNVYRCEMCPKAFRLLCELRAHFTSHKDDDEQTKLRNMQALKAEEERIQATIERAQKTEKQSL